MKHLRTLCASAMLVALACLSVHAQTRPQPVSPHAEQRDLPGRFHTKAMRYAAGLSMQAIRRQTDSNDAGAVFAPPARRDDTDNQAGGLTIQDLSAGAGSTPWSQWALDAQHTGQANVAGQSLDHIFANIVYDSLVADEQAANEGDLLAHFQVPLADSNDVFMEFKTGTYDPNDYSTQTWGENRFTWQGNSLVQVWSFTSDWKAPGSVNDFWEPVFHGVLANGFVYVPGKGGTIFKLNKATGAVITRINPFNNVNARRYTASPITADSAGNLYYNVIQITANSVSFYDNDVVDSWLVKVTPANQVTKVSYSTLTVGAPLGTDQCLNAFIEGDPSTPLPWPPSPTAVPGSVPCGTQRPGVNVAPAIAPDGTIYSVTRAHLISRWGYLVAINPNLTQKWIASLRDRLNDGCGVPPSQGGSLPPNGAPGGCRAGANLGVDPATNRPGGGRVLDDSSSTPTITPDGSILYGAYNRYNYAQGHLMKFNANGQFVKAYRFGWDQTPGVNQTGGAYSLIIKDNQYGDAGSYCNTDEFCPPDRTATNPAYPEGYFITSLNANLNIRWRFQNTNTLSCTRNPDGSITCVNDHPAGFEWCVNQFAIDSQGVVYANSEDGNLFAIDGTGNLKQKIFQQLALGAAYTPASLGPDGKIYSQNAGHLFAVGSNLQSVNKGHFIFKSGFGRK